jgi:5-methylcytosine-specific restriction protein A
VQPRVERLRGRAGQAQRLSRLRRTSGLCEDCATEGRVEVATVVDHIIPLALGGSDDDANTRNLCKRHHEQRTAEQFGHRKKVTIGADGWPSD